MNLDLSMVTAADIAEYFKAIFVGILKTLGFADEEGNLPGSFKIFGVEIIITNNAE